MIIGDVGWPLPSPDSSVIEVCATVLDGEASDSGTVTKINDWLIGDAVTINDGRCRVLPLQDNIIRNRGLLMIRTRSNQYCLFRISRR